MGEQEEEVERKIGIKGGLKKNCVEKGSAELINRLKIEILMKLAQVQNLNFKNIKVQILNFLQFFRNL